MITIDDLKKMTEKEIHAFIRYELDNNKTLPNDNKRFEMSGYENKKGETTLHNQTVLNTFAYLGIYDYTNFIVVDFYKGTGGIYYMTWINGDVIIEEDKYGGWETVEIIHDVFKATIFSNNYKRRRY